jgi:adenylate cyclase
MGSGKRKNNRMSEETARILVVDDNANNCELLTRRLAMRGYDAESVQSGRQAIAAIEAGPFDLVLLDIVMPEMSGYDVLWAIREKRGRAELPVIMATARDDSQDIIEALELGANDYVTKPIDMKVMMARVDTQLALKFTNDHNRKLLSRLEARNDFIRAAFGRYLTDEVVEQLLDSPTGLALGGDLHELTILFADLRGFTPLAEQLSPTEVVRLVNNFFGVMTDVIGVHGGTINEFFGDGILAFFGAPVPMENHARTAVACALEMQQAMEDVNRINGMDGLPTVEMGIGLNTGDVVVGNIGSEKRIKYGIVGNAVNVAARIQASCDGGRVLASESTVTCAGEGLDLDGVYGVRAKGLQQAVTVYDIRGIGGEYDIRLDKPSPRAADG